MTNRFQLNAPLHPVDVVVAKKRNGIGRVLKHYIVYVGNGTFIGNLRGGVKILSDNELSGLSVDYDPVKIKPFVGTDLQRSQAISRAYNRLGHKYHLLNFNCEHFANWVQKGREDSSQVSIAITLLILDLTYKFIKVNNGER